MNLPNAKIEYMGLNHFAYITKIEQDGKDYLQEAIESGFNSATMKIFQQVVSLKNKLK